MKDMAMISVIVPVYNVEEYLKKCLDSILCQTYSNLEILIVDDGSTDQSGLICDEYVEKDKRIRVFHQKNAGLAEARNYALNNVTGDYIAYVDSDDYIEKDMYESLLRKMDSETDIVTCGINNLFPVAIHRRNYVSYKTHKCTKYNNEEAVRELLLGKVFSFSSCDKLFRRELFEDVRFPKGRVCEDLPVLYSLIKKSRNVINIGEAKYNYVYRYDSISRRSFYPGKIYFAIFAKDIAMDVQISYPDMKREGEALYVNNIACVIDEIIHSPNRDKYSALEQYLKKILRRRMFNILKNPCISGASKYYYFRMIRDISDYIGYFLRCFI